jgi:hypothetical protein
MTRQITPFQDLESVWKLYKYFRGKNRLHTHTPSRMQAEPGVQNRLHTIIAGLPLLEATGNKRKLLILVER